MAIELDKTQKDFMTEIAPVLKSNRLSPEQVRKINSAEIEDQYWIMESFVGSVKLTNDAYGNIPRYMREMFGNVMRHGGGITGAEIHRGERGYVLALEQEREWNPEDRVARYREYERIMNDGDHPFHSIFGRRKGDSPMKIPTNFGDIEFKDGDEPVSTLANRLYASNRWGQGLDMFGRGGMGVGKEQMSLTYENKGKRTIVRYRPLWAVPVEERNPRMSEEYYQRSSEDILR
jgi:hypothetical protein